MTHRNSTFVTSCEIPEKLPKRNLLVMIMNANLVFLLPVSKFNFFFSYHGQVSVRRMEC